MRTESPLPSTTEVPVVDGSLREKGGRMADMREYHELISALVEDARQKALIGLWCDVLDQLPALRVFASAERKTAFTGGAMADALKNQRAVLRDLFRQVDAACRGRVQRDIDETTLESTLLQNLRESANVARDGIIARTKEYLLAMEEGQRASVRELVTEISSEFDERRK
jgi:hypothetical protein